MSAQAMEKPAAGILNLMATDVPDIKPPELLPPPPALLLARQSYHHPSYIFPDRVCSEPESLWT